MTPAQNVCRARIDFACLGVLLALCGCNRDDPRAPESFVKRAAVRLDSAIYDSYAGIYRLPNGALLEIVREGDQLKAGAGAHPLLAQTRLRFATNRHGGQYRFVTDESGQASALIVDSRGREFTAPRVAAGEVVDPCIRVDAGGHDLRMLACGSGHPAVVIEDGPGTSIERAAFLQAKMAELTRVVSYDHAGTGGSDSGPAPRHARQTATELRQALLTAQTDPPWVLVGASIGGHYIRVFAAMFADDVAGVVLLDPSPDGEDFQAWLEQEAPDETEKFRKASRLSNRAVEIMSQYQEAGGRAEWRRIAETQEQAHAARSLPRVPIVQITGARDRDKRKEARRKIKFYDAWLKQHIPHARHVFAEKSGHDILTDEPELVLREIRGVVEAARAARRDRADR